MPKAHSPRRGSMQYWPRKRAKKPTPRVRYDPKSKENKLLGFAGYKVGMTHITYMDENKNSNTKNEEITSSVTILECPPLVVLGARFYKKEIEGLRTVYEVMDSQDNKELKRKGRFPKRKEFDKIPEHDSMTLIVFTQPKDIGFNRKKPDVFETLIGGTPEEQLNFAKDNIGKEIKIEDVFKENEIIDVAGISKGKGFQGPVKRFGVAIQRPKKEKTKRGPGSLGGWKAQGHHQYRVAHAGQMGYHQRTEYNKQIIKISSNPKEINPKGGFINYGLVKGSYVLIKGSLVGPKKRMLRLIPTQRGKKNASPISPTYISTESKQRR